MRASLVRLRVEVERERAFLRSIAAVTARYAPRLENSDVEAPVVAYLGVELHRYYTGLENVLVRIERLFGVEKMGKDWHLDLLEGAALELPGVRPAILPDGLLEHLRDLLHFRHFFRHAYAVDLDRQKLSGVVGSLTAVAASVDQALATFEAFLAESARVI